jgi:sialate O-acetylesterase
MNRKEMIMKKCVFLVVMMFSVYAPAEVKLPAILGDHMVLQRNTKVRIWGYAAPGEKVSVQFRKQRAETQADAKGEWAVMLKPMRAGGPDDLTVTGKNTITLKDILVGEVWVCSGQSNMEWPVCASANAQEEIAASNHPQIRLFLVNRRPMGKPADDTFGQWQVCRPESVGTFSAVGYYFARFLNRELKVPVGMFDSTWGGTPAETWTPLAALKKINPGLVVQYEKSLQESAGACRAYEAKLVIHDKLLKEGKLLERHLDPGNKGVGLGWAKADFKDADWKTADMPRPVDDLLDGDGAIWVRRKIILPAEWAGHNLRLHLGVVDDYDISYWNGVPIGETNNKTNPSDWWAFERKYAIPGKLVTAGSVVLAVRIFDDFMNGGMMSPPEGMYLEDTITGKRIPLAGKWAWKVEVTMDPTMLVTMSSPMIGPYNPNNPGTLYNGMIHPLRLYAIRGAIWYQGESNAGAYGEYTQLLSTMIEAWRRAWDNPDLAFGIVQLANFMAVQPDPNTGSAWAGLREAQTKVSQTLPMTGQALAIDIGDAGNIHPKNKQDVGKRLGLWALAKVYGKWIEYSGPMYKSMKIKGGRIEVKFDHVGWGGLVAKGDKVTGFAIAGKDGKFVWAEGKIDGNKVIVWSDKIPQPIAVRYAWSDNPVCNLYNKAGLPACPFRTSE